MKIIRVIVFVVTIILINYSCSQEKTVALNSIDGYDDKCRSNGDSIEFESLDIVKLELTSESIINYIKRIELVDSIIVVQTTDNLLAFSINGKYLYKYSNKGGGPTEYLALSSFVVDRKNLTIKIIDEASCKMLTFNMNGSILSSKTFKRESIEMWTVSGIQLNNDDILFTNMIYNEKNALYTLFNTRNQKKQILYSFPVNTVNVAQPVGNSTVSIYNDTVKLLMPFDKQVYSLIDSKLIPILSIATKLKTVEQKRIKEIKNFSIMTYAELSKNKYFTGFTGIFETKDYLLLEVLFNSKYFLIRKGESDGRLFEYYLPEEIQTLPLTKIIGADSTRLIGVLEPMNFNTFNTKISGETKDVNLLKLKEVLSTLTFDSNPLLLFYKLK